MLNNNKNTGIIMSTIIGTGIHFFSGAGRALSTGIERLVTSEGNRLEGAISLATDAYLSASLGYDLLQKTGDLLVTRATFPGTASSRFFWNDPRPLMLMKEGFLFSFRATNFLQATRNLLKRSMYTNRDNLIGSIVSFMVLRKVRLYLKGFEILVAQGIQEYLNQHPIRPKPAG